MAGPSLPHSPFKVRLRRSQININTAAQQDVPSSPKPTRPTSQTVLQRIQSLFPTHNAAAGEQSGAQSATVPALAEVESPVGPKETFLKVRIVTWNMNESLPKGNLDELLGTVPIYTEASSSEGPLQLPDFDNDDSHPYHLIVVAGQECPTPSGLPLGLGAGLNKLIEWEREKEKEKDREKGKGREGEDPSKEPEIKSEKETDHGLQADMDMGKEPRAEKEKARGSRERGKDPYPKSKSRPDDVLKSPTKQDDVTQANARKGHDETIEEIVDSAISMMSTGSGLAKEKEKEKEVHHGWSALLNDHFCNGIPGADYLRNTPPPSSPVVGQGDRTPPSLHQQRRGPYELLIKERMMGIYTAIFIHRDVRHLVRGTSRSTVASGFIGGRLGNKGGVGISLNIDGTRLLFINAHLAAHEGRAASRLANMAKIKAELDVDSFLDPDDPRNMAEDVTDRFDFTFICGDLNFRLDVTRLHADWLMSRREYAQAQAFDELRNLMARGEIFVGFTEAPIRFPPTFKFDVLRTLKKKKSSSKIHRSSTRLTSPSKHPKRDGILAEVEERDGDDDGGEDPDMGDTASLASTTWTSVRSKYTTDVDDDFVGKVTSPEVLANAVPKIMMSAAHRAKLKWLSLLSSSLPPSPLHLGKPGRSKSVSSSTSLRLNDETASPISPPMLYLDEAPISTALQATPSAPDLRSTAGAKFHLQPPPMKRSQSSQTHIVREELTGDDRGVYDTSNKQRVPSWCDRILWKTTIDPGPDPDPDEVVETPVAEPHPRSQGRTNRVGQFFVHAFRRTRKDSQTSTTSTLNHRLSSTSASHPNLPSFSVEQHLPPLSATFSTESHAPRTPRPSMRGATVPAAPCGNIGMGSHPDSSDEPSDVVTPTQATSPSRRSAGVRSFSESVATDKATQMLSSTTAPSSTPQPLLILGNDHADVQVSKTSDHIIIPRRWYSLFLRDNKDNGPPSPPAPVAPLTPTTPLPPPPPKHRPGDVVCLEYNTLEDRDMRHLEGRSDHRPVIGVYALYL